LQKETNDDRRPRSRVNSLVKGGRNKSATSRDGVTRGLSSTKEYMNVGVSYQKRIRYMDYVTGGMGYIQRKINFRHSSRRKKNIHKETEVTFNEGGEDCAPLWGAEFCLLDGDEDFLDDQPASKRMRQECADDHFFGISSDDDNKDFEFEVHGGHPARVSMGDFALV
jgi:hypothetical protein